MKRRTRRWVWGTVILGVFVMLTVVCILGARSDFRGWTTYIDANSGRFRHEEFIAGVVVKRRIVETEFSELAARFSLRRDPADWLHVHGRSRGLFGGGTSSSGAWAAFSACQDVPKIIKFCETLGRPFTEKEKEQIVAIVLESMRSRHTSQLCQELHDIQSRHLEAARSRGEPGQ